MSTTGRRFARAGWELALVVVAATAVACRSAASDDWQAEARTRHWTAGLPACPCRQPEAGASNDGWALDRASSLRQHHGAAACIRSYPPVLTEAGRSGQQCCYDSTGVLVTSGSAAGTPDRATSCRGERADGRMKVRLLGFVAHVTKDVKPWARRYRSWRAYQEGWTPDNANACPAVHVEVSEHGGSFAWRAEPGFGSPGPAGEPAGAAVGAARRGAAR